MKSGSKPKAPPPAPTPESQSEAEIAREESRKANRSRKGRAGTILTAPVDPMQQGGGTMLGTVGGGTAR
jgi:hypothetical protein